MTHPMKIPALGSTTSTGLIEEASEDAWRDERVGRFADAIGLEAGRDKVERSRTNSQMPVACSRGRDRRGLHCGRCGKEDSLFRIQFGLRVSPIPIRQCD